MTYRCEAIHAFLLANADPSLAALYDASLEVQVNVLPGSEPWLGSKQLADGRTIHWQGWRDLATGETWKNFHIPWGDGTYQDSPQRWALAKHAEAIGLTGWDWMAKATRWVGFDFDSLVGHVKGLSDAELARVAEEVARVPWATARRSKSGRGLHLYVMLDKPVPTANHQEHAALARAILSLMAARTGLDLQAQVDKLGCNLWVWHRETKPGGFATVHAGRSLKVEEELPANWRDHLPVIEGRASRPPLRAWTRQELDEYLDQPSQDVIEVERLVDRTRRTPLDAEHRRLLQHLAGTKACWWWDADRHMLVCHTADLAAAHKALGLKGIFYTLATGRQQGMDQNAFAFPARDGSWVVRRHGHGAIEHPAWTRDLGGWTRCVYNAPAELVAAAAAHQGLENSKGEFVFSTLAAVWEVLRDLVAHVPELPAAIASRTTHLSRMKDGRLIVRARREPSDAAPIGWLSTPRGDWWERLIDARTEECEVDPPDDLVRASTVSGKDAGWYIKVRSLWVQSPRANVGSVLQASGITKRDLELVLGQAVLNAWELVSMPFQTEYPGDRRWNKHNARLLHVPREGVCPTWEMVLTHLGKELDEPAAHHPWCKRYAILNGAVYLEIWIASMIQQPYVKLPFLHMWGPENSGKSTLHEALKKLISGVKKADVALTSQGRFNGELLEAVLCVVEEVNLREHRVAVPRIKEWVNAETISIHPKGGTPYDVLNSTHWIQCSNPADHCPIPSGDTRITSWWVGMPDTDIPKHTELMPRLVAEAPAFLYRLLKRELPPACGRLGVPVLTTLDKQQLQQAGRSDLERFLEERTRVAPGEAVALGELFDALLLWLPKEHHQFWTLRRLGRELPRLYPKGRYRGGGYMHVGNVTLNVGTPPVVGTPLIACRDGFLRLEGADGS